MAQGLKTAAWFQVALYPPLMSAWLAAYPVKAFASHQNVVYVCTVQASAGFEPGASNPSTFHDIGRKFLLRPMTKDDPVNRQDVGRYAVFEPGEAVPAMFCERNEDWGIIDCRGIDQASFDVETGEFVRAGLSIDESGRARRMGGKITRAHCSEATHRELARWPKPAPQQRY